MTRQTNYMSGNVKRFGFLRNSTQTDWVDICSKNPCFSSACFSKAFRKFSVRRMTMFNIFENLCKIIPLCSRKKTSIIQHIDPNILTKDRFALEKIRFTSISISTTVVNHHPVLRYILISKSWKIFFKGQKCHFPIPKSFLISQRLLWKKFKSIRLIFLKISYGTGGRAISPPLQVIM